MGRTIPTANMLISEEADLFMRTYGSGLSDREREALYNMLQLCKKHTNACGQAVRLVPFHGMLMSIMLEHQKRIELLMDKITSLGGKS